MDASSPDDPPPILLTRAGPVRSRATRVEVIPLVMPVGSPAATSAPRRPTVIAPPPDWVEPGSFPRATRVSSPDRDVPRPPVVRRKRRAPVRPLMITMGFFAALMTVSFAQVCYTLLTADQSPTQTTEQTRGALVNELMIFEGVDSVLVLVCLATAGLPLARRAVADPFTAWLVAGPALVVMLGVNIGYTLALRGLAGADADEMPIDVDLAAGWIAILLVCIQPAVMEELFFRYLLLGHLRSHLGLHGAVWVSSIIFGMAHLGNPIGWPVLILLGAGLGYSRVASGSLALPIALHFLHNLAVLVANELMFR